MPLFFASCAKNLEGLLREELMSFGALSPKETVAGVYFEGNIALAYRVCLWSRLANHIFLQLSHFEANNADELYQKIQRNIRWSDHLASDGTFSIEVTGHHPTLINPLFTAQKIKDAIVDQIRDKTGKRPSIQNDRPQVLLHCHLDQKADKNLCTLSLNLSGESLHRRGYRLEGGKAPLKETLAAAILIRAGWLKYLAEPRENYLLLDPLCGTGTLLIEAASMALDIAPGLDRDYFGFFGWAQHIYHLPMWAELHEEAKTRKAEGLLKKNIKFIGSDVHPQAISKSLENIVHTGLSEKISVQLGDCANLKMPEGHPSENPGFIICNPPYGERMNTLDMESLEFLFKNFGEALKKDFIGWQLAIFSGSPRECIQAIKMRAKKTYPLFNGTIPCQLYLYTVSL
jgi:23S rRNA (guanine2445-N2)-methyltransferase / 23S rRNA (guanine2069-N7)-methyltransferase